MATFIKVSKPTTSAVLNVADFGLPVNGPVKESISFTVRPISCCNLKIALIENTPILFAINAGVSLHNTAVFPKNKSAYLSKNLVTSVEVVGVGIISNNLKYLGGLKKCVPQKCF